MHIRLLENGRNLPAFWLGCALVAAGVILHLPMYLMARHDGFVLRGWIAVCSKLGGLAAQALSVAGAVPHFAIAIAIVAAPPLDSAALIALVGHETLKRDLRDLEPIGEVS